jgi:hypothetical protein
MHGGTKGELNIAKLLAKRGSVIATSLRGRPVTARARSSAAVREHVWPMIADGRVAPDRPHHHADVRGGRPRTRLFDCGGVIGKVLLTVPAYGGANGDGG